MASPDLAVIERQWRAGQISNREIARQHGRSEAWVRKLAKAHGWTRDLAGAVRSRVRESLVRDGVRANQCELMGVVPSDAAIIDEAAAIGVEVVRSHRRDIRGLRGAVGDLLDELGAAGKMCEVSTTDEGKPVIKALLKITDRSRVLAELARAMALLIPLERQAFGLDEDRPGGSQPMTVVWEGMPAPAYD